MKRIAVIFLLIISIFNLKAQIDNIKIIDTRNDEIPLHVNGKWEIMDHYKVNALLNDNIYSFFNLHDKYPSELKKKMFENTSEYNEVLVPVFQQAKNDLKNTDYAILYYLYNNSDYDVKNRCFKFSISAITPDPLKHPNTFSVQNFYTITVPSIAFELETGTHFGRPYERRYFVTPTISEDIAVDVEDAMKVHPCPYSLLFIVNIEGLKEQNNSLGFSMPYILTKAKEVYLYNTDTEEVVADLNSIFTAPTPTPKSSTSRKPSSGSSKKTKSGTRR